ncbi:MAG: hypothetical protein Q7T97_15160 [Burkholderiaceae bacterium]|nr:hypothetical protein [Burkholderiaceae bacterium]
MKSIFIVVLALFLSACDSVDEAVSAGNHMNQTLQKCVDHMKAKQGNTDIPECNGLSEQAEYLKAKSKVKEPSAVLDAIDQKSMQLRQEAIGMMQGSAK